MVLKFNFLLFHQFMKLIRFPITSTFITFLPILTPSLVFQLVFFQAFQALAFYQISFQSFSYSYLNFLYFMTLELLSPKLEVQIKKYLELLLL